MGTTTNISWTDATWNPCKGCSKISEGCRFCYMMRMLDRFGVDGTVVQKTAISTFNMPLKYKKTKSDIWDGKPLMFTPSLSDIFHSSVDAFRNEIWDIIRKCQHIIFQIPTKRPERILQSLPPDWGKGWHNVWLGVSVENQKRADERIPILLDIPAIIRFLSCEPLLGELDLTNYLYTRYVMGGARHMYNQVDWVICGGESGFGKTPEDKSVKWQYRKCEIDWLYKIVHQCQQANVPLFVKQLGTHLAKTNNLTGSAADINEFPEHLKVREFPKIVV